MDFINRHDDQEKRGLTCDLWKNFPAHQILRYKDAHEGIGVSLDPAASPYAANGTTQNAGGWNAYADANEYVRGLLVTEHKGGGTRLFTTTDNAAAEMQAGGGGEPFIISDTAADAKDFVFECAIRASLVTASKAGWFAGVASVALGGDIITDAGALAAADSFLGVFKPEGNTTGIDLVYQLGGQTMVEHVGDWQTIAAATWYHFGLRFNAKTKVITPWWGTGDRSTTPVRADTTNIITATDIASAGTDKFPDGVGLTPTFAVKAAAADDFSLDVRLCECGQRAFAAS